MARAHVASFALRDWNRFVVEFPISDFKRAPPGEKGRHQKKGWFFEFLISDFKRAPPGPTSNFVKRVMHTARNIFVIYHA